MAHEITDTDNLFSVREATWHGLGSILGEYPTRDEAKAIAHPWEPVSEPVYRKVSGITPEGELWEKFVELESHVANVRSDNSDLLGVVTETYTPVTNSEMYEMAEAIESGDSASVRYETGGSLRGGRQVWLMLRMNDPIVIKGDPRGEAIPYYLLQNSHDACGAFRGSAVFTRVVCKNTSVAADYEASKRGTTVSFRHTKNIGDRIEQARQALVGWRTGVNEWKLFNEHLLTLPVSQAGKNFFIEKFIPAPPPHVVTDRVMRNVEAGRDQLSAILQSITCEGIENTAYGLVQAATEYGEHFRATRNEETRFRRSFLEPSVIVRDAVALSQEAALV